MDLLSLKALSAADQQIFLLGRLTAEPVRMDIAMRFLNSGLLGHRDFESFMDTTVNFTANANECLSLIAASPDFADDERDALASAVDDAKVVYAHRNRYAHDHLRRSLLNREQWELARIARPVGNTPEVIPVSFDDMVALVQEVVAVTYRLRACAMHVMTGGASTWRDLVFSPVQGDWDGSVEWIGAD